MNYKKTYLIFVLYISTSLLLNISLGIYTEAQAQKKQSKSKPSKEEARRKREDDKKTKNELKNFTKNPDAFRRFQQSKENAERQRDSLLTEIGRVSQLEQQCEKEVETLRSEYEALLKKNRSLEESVRNATKTEPAAPASPCQSIPDKGVFYSVQIGAFKQVNLDKNVNDKKVDMKKENEEGFDKYIISYFDTYQKAANFKNMLSAMGLKQMWIVTYKDGKRTSVNEVK